MTHPLLHVLSTPAEEIEADVVVLGATSGAEGPTLHAPEAYAGIADRLAVLGVTGAADELVRLTDPTGRSAAVAIIGLGKYFDADALRRAAGAATRKLAGVAHVAFAIPLDSADDAEALLEGAALGTYRFTEFKGTGSSAPKPAVAEVTVVVPEGVEVGTDRPIAVAEAIALVKDLVNTPPRELFPQSFAEAAAAAVAELPVDVKVWDEHELEADGFGGILGVGQGSSRLPRLVRLGYAPEGASVHLALVGKGITFDSGGLSLKPPASMVGMKYDMTGAATVLAVLKAVAELRLPVQVTAWLCLAENLPSGTAIRPNDVLTIRGGQTVEVLNTDAEGRLVLADGLVAASEEHPDAIIDVATLTGAAVVALGTSYTAVMGDVDLVTEVITAAEETGEQMWPMPLPPELREVLSSDVADIANAKPGNTAAGALIAGVFLQEFIGTAAHDDEERIPWAHLDIAGSGNRPDGAAGFTTKGPTGVAVRTLLAMAEEFSRA
ncbi:leucyl aminopeptidase [Plantibacter sp. YIM 135249]|uniref:leucyl aminopeptidase n=1 Tax=Plantibacter sp. YIM 135249 TaxID=3423918 RepID=UPI003D335B46